MVASQRAVCPNMQLPNRRQTEDCLIRFSKHTGFTDQDTGMLISKQWRRALFGNVKSK